MSYIFTGRLRAHTCGGAVVPVANATLMLYRPQKGEDAGFVVREPEAVREREFLLVAQGRSDENGEFRIDLREKSIYGHRGTTHPYAGEPIVIEAYVRSADGTPPDHDVEPVQFSVGAQSLVWQGEGDERTARFDFDIGEQEWIEVRRAFDLWRIHGRVLRAGTREPAAGLKVLAYDADLLQDDYLGSATTDADGHFRIDYSGATFRQTSVPGADFERGGPEVYFRIESPDGAVVYEEAKSRGSKPDRADVSNCFEVELVVDGAPAARS